MKSTLSTTLSKNEPFDSEVENHPLTDDEAAGKTHNVPKKSVIPEKPDLIVPENR